MDLQKLKKTNFVLLSQEILNDNPILYSKIQSAAEVTKEEVPTLLEEVLRFLFLIKFGNQILTPSHIVDLAWHELILCTRYYAEFCEKHFAEGNAAACRYFAGTGDEKGVLLRIHGPSAATDCPGPTRAGRSRPLSEQAVRHGWVAAWQSFPPAVPQSLQGRAEGAEESL